MYTVYPVIMFCAQKAEAILYTLRNIERNVTPDLICQAHQIQLRLYDANLLNRIESCSFVIHIIKGRFHVSSILHIVMGRLSLSNLTSARSAIEIIPYPQAESVKYSAYTKFSHSADLL